MSNPSNLLLDDSTRIQDFKYLYASNTNVSNFVSVKLSGNNNYHLWETQMFCLMESHNMRGFVDPKFSPPKDLSPEIKEQYNSLLKGWIFGSVSEDVLGVVVKEKLAKEVWDKLKNLFFTQDSAYTEGEAIEETKAKDFSAETEIEDSVQTKPEVEEETKDKVVPRETETEDKDTNSPDEEKKARNCRLRKATFHWNWSAVKAILEEDENALTAKLNSDGNTVLHLAVGIKNNYFVRKLLQHIELKTLPTLTSLDGSTALHVAAIVGNRDAAEILVEANKNLLTTKDKQEEVPLLKAFSNMQYDSFMYLWDAAENDDEKSKDVISKASDIEKGVKLLVNAISAKQYKTAKELVEKFPRFAREDDEVLMAIAKTFPSGLNYWETFIYPSFDDVRGRIILARFRLNFSLKRITGSIYIITSLWQEVNGFLAAVIVGLISMLVVLIMMLLLVYLLIRYMILLLIWMIYFPFFMLYFLSWEVATRLAVPPIKHIVKKYKKWEEAKMILKLLCNEIESKHHGAHHSTYKRPILEAARQNAFEVVDEILLRSPEAIQYKDKSGYDIIQVAVMHRSEKIYNLIYRIVERKNQCRTFKDTSNNNILHLAGRLAPSEKLKYRTGAALQLQLELQWLKELKTIVFPSYITEENIYKETPAMVFTREHEHLVKEGEKWMKITAESCSITAGLIITIVFAAAITVPGGSNDKTGTPLFTKDIAFIIFAISDAISLFTASTSLLVFLSILTARFAEQDFLVRLPRRLIIGLCTLFVSTTAMIVAFSSTLFLVFCDKKPWMLAPICGLACIPIVFFVTLQFPLIVDLIRSTYVPIFGKNYQGRFDPDEVQGFFSNSHQRKFNTMFLGKGKAEQGAKPPSTAEQQGGANPPPTAEQQGGAKPLPTAEQQGGAKPLPTAEQHGGAKSPPTAEVDASLP